MGLLCESNLESNRGMDIVTGLSSSLILYVVIITLWTSSFVMVVSVLWMWYVSVMVVAYKAMASRIFNVPIAPSLSCIKAISGY